MFIKLLAERQKLLQKLPWVVLPMYHSLSLLEGYRNYLQEYRMANIESIDDTLKAASRQPIEVEIALDDGETGIIMTSEHEMAVDYYEDEYYQNTHLYDTFLLEGFIYKSHQQLDWMLSRLCESVEPGAKEKFEDFSKAYKKKEEAAPLLYVRGKYLQKILSPQNDPDRGRFNDLLKELERISIVRNCVMHEDNAIDNGQFVPKIKQFLRDNDCGLIEERGSRQIIVLNYKYPEYLIDFITHMRDFIKLKIEAWLKTSVD